MCISCVAAFVTNRCFFEALWIAGHRIDPGNNSSAFQWRLNDGSSLPMLYTNWFSGQPNNRYSNEDCVQVLIKAGYKWSDQLCGQLSCFLCEIEL